MLLNRKGEIMLYPKVKKKKIKFKTIILDILDEVKIRFYKLIKIMIDKDYFILFMKKSFHL